MEFYEIAGIVSGVFAFAEYILYILGIYGRDYRLRKIERTSPNRATWFIWAALGTITASSYVASGATDTIWFPIAYALGYIIVAILSIRYGEGGWEKMDIFCLFGAGVSILLWWYLHSPEAALYATVFVDVFGLMPTIKKSWLRPEGENLLSWIMTPVASGLNVVALDWGSATFAIALYPFYMFLTNMLIVGILLARSNKSSRARRA